MSQRRQTQRLTGEEVYQYLYTAILEGDIAPGSRLRESDIAERLGTSRTPVREALRRLETQGLLTHEAHRGMSVPELDAQMVTELYLMREVLEGTAAALTAQHASNAEIAVLKDLLAQDRDLLGDPRALAKTNRQFHQLLYQGAHNRYLLKSLNALRDAMALLGPTSLGLAGRPKEALEEHASIVAAIEQRDSDAAERSARTHIREAHRARLKLMLGRDSRLYQGRL